MNPETLQKQQKAKEKVLETIVVLKEKFSNKKPLLEMYERIECYLKGEEDEDLVFKMFDFFFVIDVILNVAKLTAYEKGYIFDLLIQANTRIASEDIAAILLGKEQKEELKSVRLTIEEFTKIIQYYYQNKEFPNMSKNAQAVVEKIIQKETVQQKRIRDNYQKIKEFYDSEKEQEDYQKVNQALQNLAVKESLIKAFNYYHQKTQLNMKKEKLKKSLAETYYAPKKSIPATDPCIPSKRQLKTRLAEYYNPLNQDMKKRFDYSNLDDLLYILYQLNQSKRAKEDVLNNIFQNAIENYSYYAYLFQKKKWMNPRDKSLTDIMEYFQEMMICSPEEYVLYKEEIIRLLEEDKMTIVSSFDYEMQRMKRNKK